ncbi:hypothetical protein TPHA_0C00620 [Tetrapisispora phaffii CBS 4417]|uniref:glucan endo-1,3-beta-D-glucosidase n=1 Tax=Tetrapisispora phaffii (strain ATCC 24235 / CBS 4417 / NBRC 1672 / NRRL Y-8282 / UCD 70-5) TaxID=1071381 RepID=G8BR43_TETPH|nr:hypothetical protein TPHA_0C00620 [Tetrapisispora phaffii CBS 4417]CCE62219.1 hypothetical protein TPHA_0C00620 [Tetrapisispora phaffii CBS 4417]
MTIIGDYIKFEDLFNRKTFINKPPLSAFTKGKNEINLSKRIYNNCMPIQTNKFYSNLLINDQQNPVWVYPYSINYHKLENDNDFFGLGINCNYSSNDNKKSNSNKFINKNCVTIQNTDIKPFIFSSIDFHTKNEMFMTLSNMKQMSLQIYLKKNQSQFIWFPVVQGMGMITAVYYNLIPKLQSEIGFKSIKQIPIYFNSHLSSTNKKKLIKKYSIVLQDNSKWLLYTTERYLVNSPENVINCLRIKDYHTIVGNLYSKGTIFQLIPDIFTNLKDVEEVDYSIGCYPIDCVLKFSNNDDYKDDNDYITTEKNNDINSKCVNNISDAKQNESYLMYDYQLGGHNNSEIPLIFILPHHQKLIDHNSMSKFKINSFVNSPVLGSMIGYLSSKIILKLTLPKENPFESQLGGYFNLQSNIKGSSQKLLTETINEVKEIANEEAITLIETFKDIGTMKDIREIGKQFYKYSWFLYCSYFILNDIELTIKLLPLIKDVFNKFINDTLFNDILQYDTKCGGLITSSQYTDNYYYNEHNYDYSYFIISSAIIGKIELLLLNDTKVNNNDLVKDYFNNTAYLWLDNKVVVEWCENLIRDYNNPSDTDEYYPSFRTFDWYHGHSWSIGLIEGMNGKEYYSSGEDLNSLYAVNLWGLVTENKNLINISRVQLSLLKCSINSYVQYYDIEQDKIQRYYNKDNIESIPRLFASNQVCGMLSDNKLLYKKLKGLEISSQSKIHLQHILPINPLTNWVRNNEFIENEYNTVIKELVSSLSKIDKRELHGYQYSMNKTFKTSFMINISSIRSKEAFQYLLKTMPKINELDKSQSLTWALLYAMSFRDADSELNIHHD